MGLEILLVVLGVTLFLGLFLALLFNLRDIGARIEAPAAGGADSPAHALRFYAEVPATAEDRTVLYIEHYLRRETLKAQRFAEDPCVETLWEEDDRVAYGG